MRAAPTRRGALPSTRYDRRIARTAMPRLKNWQTTVGGARRLRRLALSEKTQGRRYLANGARTHIGTGPSLSGTSVARRPREDP